jgi:hypothetical protein
MTDAAAEPLISHNREYPDDERHSEDHAQDTGEEVDESALAAPGRFIWWLTICAGVSGLLFGYEYVFFSRIAYVVEVLTLQYRRDFLDTGFYQLGLVSTRAFNAG